MSRAASPSRRRADVQGLRAVAILLVVAYHGGFGLSGGFTGVDVFFVISGFVITMTLLDELSDSGRLSFLAFYVRRAKRLLPGLALMLCVVALLGTILSPVGSQRAGALTGIWASLFTANAFLYRLGTGYFDVKGTLDPLLHTWTLAVEEQFYVLFPALLFIAWRVGRRWWNARILAFAIVGGVSAISFLLSFELSHGHLIAAEHRPQQIAFYGSPTRAWEFGAGALLALATPVVTAKRLRLAAVIAVGGIAAIAYGAISIAATAALPGGLALFPVIGTAAAIAAGSAGNNRISRLLGVRPLVWIGDLSYSWYLWHWPLIVYAKALWPGGDWPTQFVAVSSLIPAWASFRWIENPIRFSTRLQKRRMFAMVAICIAAPLTACAGLWVTEHFLSRTVAIRAWEQSRAPHLDAKRGCEGTTPFGLSTPPGCTWHKSGSHRSVVLIGDSNASHIVEGVVRAGVRAGFNVTVATFYGCPLAQVVVIGTSAGRQACESFRAQSVSALVHSKPNLVVMAARDDVYINASNISLAPLHGPATSNSARKARIWQTGLTATLLKLNRAGIPVIVVQPPPQILAQPTECAVILVLTESCGRSVSRTSVDRELRRALIAQRGATAAARARSYALNLEGAFCGRLRCTSYRRPKLLYTDSDHLSVAGALTLTHRFYAAVSAHARR